MFSFVFSILCPLAAICDAEVDRQCPSTALERGPSLIGTLDAVKALAYAHGHSGRFSFDVTVTETGTVRDAVVLNPKALDKSEKVREAIGSLKFCPAVRHSRYVSVKVRFEVVLQ